MSYKLKILLCKFRGKNPKGENENTCVKHKQHTLFVYLSLALLICVADCRCYFFTLSPIIDKIVEH